MSQNILEKTRVAKSFSDLPINGEAYAQNSKGEWMLVEITDHIVDSRSAIFNEVSYRFIYNAGVSQGYTDFVHKLRVSATDNEVLREAYDAYVSDRVADSDGVVFPLSFESWANSYHNKTNKTLSTSFRASQEVKNKQAVASAVKTSSVSQQTCITQGFFTVVYPEHNTHRTFRVKEVKEGNLAGKVIIGFLVGQDNENAYLNFGFLENNQIKFWNRFKTQFDDTKRRRIEKAFEKVTNNTLETGLNYALASKRCFRCNRLLTHPESITNGLGPECASIMGV